MSQFVNSSTANGHSISSPERRNSKTEDSTSGTADQSSVSRGRQPTTPGDVTESLKAIQFVEPAEGTPAALALAANAAIKVTKFDKGLHKFRGLKRPKMKSLNIVKKINKTTKNKRKKRHFSKNFKGKVIDGVHELYTLTAGMMLGINHSLGITALREQQSPNQPIVPADFTDVTAVPFPAKGCTDGEFVTPPHKLVHTFNFKTYAPRVFARIRDFFDVDMASYKQSVCGDYNYVEFISNSKSGQFFFYSHDGRYMLKTQTKEENKFLLSILPQYYEYLRENPNSLLVRILGMHRVNMYHLRRKVHFVIMASVFDTPAKIHRIYDLKGSLTGREATPEERAGGGVLKDNDLIRDQCKFHLGPKKPAFIAQLRKDADFLARLNIMDYSLLVGIHYRSQRPTVEAAEGQPLPTAIVPAMPHSNLPFRRTSTVEEDGRLSEAEGAVTSPPQTVRRSSVRRNSAAARAASPGRALATYSTESMTAAEHNGPATPKTTRVLFPEDSVTAATSPQDVAQTGTYYTSPSVSSDYDSARQSNVSSRAAILLQSPSTETAEVHTVQTQSQSDRATLSNSEATGTGEMADIEEEGEEEGDSEGESGEEEEDYEDIDEGDSDREEYVPFAHNYSQYISAYNMNISFFRSAKPAVTTGAGADPAATRPKLRRPWTDRADLGINSRTASGRGDEIYYLGVIDILQQYNVQKRFETMVKGITGDVRLISAIDAPSYARRFVRFINENTN